MSRALLTFATGDHRKLLDLSLPRFEQYADLHGYQLISRPPKLMLRPVSWYKLPALIAALEEHEEALWLDADVVILDSSRDIADEVTAEAWQALACHHTPDGEVPNLGVWYVRRPMQAALRAAWARDRYVHHPWWEQAAMLGLLGYRLEKPVQLVEPTPLYDRTDWLGLEWNSHEQNDRHPSPRFAHATAGSLEWRVQVMQERLAAEPALEGAARCPSTS